MKQLTIFDQWTDHKRQTIPKWTPTTHLPDKPPITSDRLIVPKLLRHSIPDPETGK